MAIDFQAVPANAIASGVFIEQEYKRTGPPAPIQQRIALIGQYDTSKDVTVAQPVAIASEEDAIKYFGSGSMLHLLARKLFRNLGSSTVQVDAFPVDPALGAEKSEGTITVSGGATSKGVLTFYIAGEVVKVSVANEATEGQIADAIKAAINAKTDLPVTADAASEVVTLTAKWEGKSGDDISVLQNYGTTDFTEDPAGVTITIAPMGSGSGSADKLEDVFKAFGATWYTWVVNPYTETTELTAMEEAGDDRMDPGVKRPFVGVVGNTMTKANFLTWLVSRNSPWTTAVSVEGSPSLPGEIAAAVAGVCAVSAQSEPARPFKNLQLKGILPGKFPQWTYAEINAVQSAGGAVAARDSAGLIRIHDLVTTRTKTAQGADDESWRHTVTITNIQAKINSLEQLFLAAPFDRAVIIDDDTVTGKSFAISPKRLKAYIIKLIDDQWIPEAWSKNRDEIVAGIKTEINKANPNRIDVLIPDIIAVGLRIIAVKLQWSFAPAE